MQSYSEYIQYCQVRKQWKFSIPWTVLCIVKVCWPLLKHQRTRIHCDFILLDGSRSTSSPGSRLLDLLNLTNYPVTGIFWKRKVFICITVHYCWQNYNKDSNNGKVRVIKRKTFYLKILWMRQTGVVREA